MEVTCDIIRRKDKQYNKVKGIEKFKNLELSNKIKNMDNDKFMDVIKNPKFKKASESFIKDFINNNNHDIGFSLLVAYYICAYADKIFMSPHTSFEMKLVSSATQTVAYIENIINSNPDTQKKEEFCNYLDYYYSLYSIWMSQDHILEVNNLIEDILKNIQIYKMIISREYNDADYINSLCDNITSSIDKMFEINYKVCVKKLLDHYDIFTNVDSIKKHIWGKIGECYFKNRETIILIVVTELKSKIIPFVTSAIDRKDIYYNVDTEEIIKKIQDNEFNVIDLNNIIHIFLNVLNEKTSAKYHKKLDKYEEWNEKYDEIALSIYRYIFDTIKYDK
jgi:hypothetical protein